MRSYSNSAGVSPSRRPGGEDAAGHPRGDLVIAGPGTEPYGAARLLARPEAEVSTPEENR
ncbi:hypothetical protein [Streptosporangium sp. NPDC000509]|uniref:hypothetical protein n=1 Tax=Streptosporangium sp. NPDC000509 TaxID=3366186 RepID=UPI0036830755